MDDLNPNSAPLTIGLLAHYPDLSALQEQLSGRAKVCRRVKVFVEGELCLADVYQSKTSVWTLNEHPARTRLSCRRRDDLATEAAYSRERQATDN